jgi:hypothetical protein
LGILNPGDAWVSNIWSNWYGADFNIYWDRWGSMSDISPEYGWFELYFRELFD